MLNKIMMEHMTWLEIEKALKEGFKTVIICGGAVEQHGPYLPLFTDARIGEALMEQVALLLDKTLVAPIIRPGLSKHHMIFPGTITLREETYRAILRDYIISLKSHGFNKFILLSTHGGNFEETAKFAKEIEMEFSDVKISTPLESSHEIFRICFNIAEELGVEGKKAGAHAGWFETSQMMSITPDLVNQEVEYESGYTGPINGSVMRKGLKNITPNGIMGDPRGSTADVGRIINEKLAKAIFERIKSVK
ncbi:MAG: creatininase family protein [Candidatus Hodarchaeota archaeon]